ncbi:MAG TPA: ABC transporter permease [Kofleriaceae bacterium]|jgi:putative ABC transport system permease protein
MIDIDNWREVWSTLKANPLRTFLTAFGVFWGIFMLMVMLGFGTGMQSSMKNSTKGLATNLLFCWGQTTNVGFDGLPIGREVKFDTTDIPRLKKLPGVEWLAPRLQLGGFGGSFTVSYDGKVGAYTVMGDYPDFKHIVAFEYDEGRFLNDRDIAEQRKVAVIGAAVRDELFPPGKDPMGEYIKISGVYFEVVGVMHTLRTGPQGDRDAHSVFIPFSTLKIAFHTGERVEFFALTAKPGTDGEELENEVREALTKAHRVDPTDRLAIGSFNLFELFNKVDTFMLVLALVSWIVGTMTLLAGVIGVSNIMLITVKERTKEIGVRKALGATRRSIIAMVMKESVVLTAFAGLLGVAFGTFVLLAASAGVSHLQNFPLGDMVVSLGTAVRAVAILIAAGAFAGLMPAAHAASIKPIEALRTE